MAHGRGASGETREVVEQPLQWPEALLGAAQRPEGAEVRDGKGALEVALLWGDRLLDVQQFGAQEPATLGHSTQARMHVFDRAIGERFELIRHEGTERYLRIPADARFTCFDAAGAPIRAGDGSAVREVPLREGERAVLALSQLTVTVREVGVAPRVKVNPFVAGDYAFFKVAAITALVAIAVVVAGEVSLEHDVFLDDEVLFQRSNVIKIITRVETPPPPPAIVKAVQEAKERAAGTETKATAKPKGDPERKRVDPKNTGLLVAIRELGGGVFDPGGNTSKELDLAYNNLGRGRQVVGIGPGSGIDGPRGPGSGGGGGGPGMGWGDGPLTKGPARGPAFGELDGGLRGRVTPTSPEQQKVTGNGLDREEIAKVIRRHQNEIKYCYENALREAPELSGKVAVSFVIDPTGAVAQADVAETTLESASAETCMLSRIRRWRFPEPRGGGVVAVNFPWLFKPVGGEAE